MADPVLVISGSGFIGSHVANELEATGRRVVTTSRNGLGADLDCDFTDPASTDRAVAAARPGAIVIIAGQASVTAAWDDPPATFSANVAGPFNVLDSARRLAPDTHVLFTSSAGAYGSPGTRASVPFTESDPVSPTSPYGASKAAAEMLCRQFDRQTALTVTIARLFNQVGPGLDDAQAPAEFAREIAKAERRGERILDLPVGDPSIERDFTDVRDTAHAYSSILEHGMPGVFNVCSGTGVSLEKIIELLQQHTGIEVRVVPRPDAPRPSDIPLVYGSHGKLTGATGWRPITPLDTSLADLLADWRRRV
ncbi:MAG: GDP-mannose 4,6-dehydratase [Actinomycetota bacterium]|nr:GDP-mannose 4,6-dehydratase [Actinomycetota bacterium]